MRGLQHEDYPGTLEDGQTTREDGRTMGSCNMRKMRLQDDDKTELPHPEEHNNIENTPHIHSTHYQENDD